MRFIKIANTDTTTKDFVDSWSRFYYDKLEKYYVDNIGKNKHNSTSIEELFKWKNGGILSNNKKKFLENVLTRIKALNELKVNFDEEIFKKEFEQNRMTIWTIFLRHIISPEKYPIFDQHVNRAFRFAMYNEIEPKIQSKNMKNRYEEYKNFFLETVENGIDSKKLDEALWVFGKFLKQYGKGI